MRVRRLITRIKDNSGFTLVEVLIAMLILSMVAAAGTYAFVFAVKMSRSNEYDLMATNLAEDRIEYIRSLEFAEVGTKSKVGGVNIYGDPAGEILQTEEMTVDGINYTVNTNIGWVEHTGWDLESADWDYKSVKVEVIPELLGESRSHTKVLETMVTRNSTQPMILEGNISLRMVRGWKENPEDTVVVPNVKVNLIAGPNAPKNAKTDSSGIVRFLNLVEGNYTVKLDPSNVGMMLYPGNSSEWQTDVAVRVTKAREFIVELPCRLKLNLKDLDGNPINMDTEEKGTINMDTPYGVNISKDFTGAVLDRDGALPADYLGGLWPVGSGYAGAYSVSDISIPESTYLGAYEMTGGEEAPWSGTFLKPDTVKEIICYFGVTPDTPYGVDENWADAMGDIITGEEAYTAADAKFASGDLSKSLVMKSGKASAFNADRLYFENKGSDEEPGLQVENRARLALNAGIIVFRGRIEMINAPEYSDTGKMILSTVFTDGSSAPFVTGSEIGEEADQDKNYGKVYLVKPLVHNGIELIRPGGYYFYDGLTLPDNASELIPITKENYVKQ